MTVTAETAPDFSAINPPRPSYDDIAGAHESVHKRFDEATSADDRAAAVREWDALRRRVGTWAAMTSLRFEQDTRDKEHKAELDYCNELQPKITDLDVKLKRKLITSPHRGELEERFGAHAFALWEADIATFDPKIEKHLVTESKLTNEYTELLSSASFDFRGQKVNLSSIGKYANDADRDTRHEARAMTWQFFADNAKRLDQLFDDLTKLRHEMATTLGYDDYLQLGYKKMQRIDYDRADVEGYRQQVAAEVVPLATKLFDAQRERLGLEKLMAWDEGVFDTRGNPKPAGDHDWMLERAQTMFDGLGPELAAFFRMMVDKHLLDLQSREGKAPGGFCTSFAEYGLPYIFANFNGTKGDVEVFTHEAGHAFQGWTSREKDVSDYLWPTAESCEIHSMSLEFISWPYMELFFEDDAERFRQIHLAQSLTFLPYCVAVDEFQHLVYARPEATPAERHAMWLQMEHKYLPQRDWGDLGYPAQGGCWQGQLHIYGVPFYYIDYALAQTCALQFWVRSREDAAAAMKDYVELCGRGGEAPFQVLATSAGLRSPFAEGALISVVEHARRELGA